MFETTNLKVNIIYYLSAVGFLFAIQDTSVGYIAVAALVHVVVISIFSGVTHRFFCHKAYKANKHFAWLLSTLPVAYGYANPLAWSVMHTAHHAFADTPKDPHVNGWKGLFTAAYRTPPKAFLTNSRWFVDSKHKLLHRYSLLWLMVWQTGLFLISVDVFLWAGVVPLFTLKLGDGLHRALSHKDDEARNRWYLEYICPMGGEWIHAEHHSNASKPIFANRWYEIDTGSLFVRALRTTA